MAISVTKEVPVASFLLSRIVVPFPHISSAVRKTESRVEE
jgi:hypothetical protein